MLYVCPRFVLLGKYFCLLITPLFLLDWTCRFPPFEQYMIMSILLRLYIDDGAYVCEDIPCVSLIIVIT